MTYEALLRENNVPVWHCPEDGAFLSVNNEDILHIYFDKCRSCDMSWRWDRSNKDWDVYG